MKNEPLNPDVENVITVSFGEVPNDIAHPASKNYPEEIDDPLQDLLDEAMIEDEILEEESEHYIFAHDKSWDYSVSMDDTPMELSSNLSNQITRLKEDIKRLKYYLDEMSID